MQYENTIKKICEKTKDSPEEVFAFEQNLIDDEYTPDAFDTWLFGFLKSKDTLIAVFGEDQVDFNDGLTQEAYTKILNDLPEERKANIRIRRWALAGTQPSWEYHHNQMGYTLDEILAYYEKYLT